MWGGSESFSYHGASVPVGQGLLIFEDSLPHSDIPHTVGFLWTSNRLSAEISTWQHTTTHNRHHPYTGGIQTHNPSKRAAADPRLRPRGHWDRRSGSLVTITLPERPGRRWRYLNSTASRPTVGASIVSAAAPSSEIKQSEHQAHYLTPPTAEKK
jgi:hypothetical protein